MRNDRVPEPRSFWSRDLVVPGEPIPGWMVELAEQVGMIGPEELAGLPVGVIVGSAVIERVVRCPLSVVSGEMGGRDSRTSLCRSHDLSPLTPGPSSLYAWHLMDVERATRFRRPRNHPQPVWFKPF